VVAVAVQVGANYANDYADGVRGSDQHRVGPLRLTASGLARPGQVRAAALVSFGVAGAAGLVLASVAGWWLVAVGLSCVAAGWFYTAGPRPYGYLGLGELFVFVYFGLVATVGSAFVQHGRMSALALAASVPVGLLSVGLLESNNLRDLESDAAAGKRTLAVRAGPDRAPWLYVGAIGLALASVGAVGWWRPDAVLALAAVPLAIRPCVLALRHRGREVGPVLAATGRLQMAVGLLLTVGLAL
jgi:1,4-dihydroxy-2-naphthoate octaprenyltransferase